MGVHIGVTWRIRLNGRRAAAMRPCVKLLWPVVLYGRRFDGERRASCEDDVPEGCEGRDSGQRVSAWRQMCQAREHRQTGNFYGSSVCLQLPTYADNVALPAFALRARPCCINRSTSLARRARSSESAAAWAHAGTDRRTGTVPFYRPCSAYYAGSANKTELNEDIYVTTVKNDTLKQKVWK